MSIGQLEFFYDQAPESIRSISMAWYYSLISVGSYLSYILVTVGIKLASRWSSEYSGAGVFLMVDHISADCKSISLLFSVHRCIIRSKFKPPGKKSMTLGNL
jgi:hypothetical protein